jgi:hypothetical protein
MVPNWLKAAAAGLLLAGCGPTPPVEEPELRLEPIHSWTLTGDLMPTAASALSVDEVVFADRDGKRAFLLSDTEPTLLAEFKNETLRALTFEVDSRLVWLAVDRRIFSIDVSDPTLHHDRPALLQFEFKTADVSSLWASASQVWVALASDESSRVVVLDRSQEGPLSVVSEHIFPGRMAVFPFSEGAALAQQFRYPFVGHELKANGSITAAFRPDGQAFAEIIAENPLASWVVGATLPLGDTLVLMWLSDLHALQRLAVLARRNSGAIIRVTPVEGAIGLVHRLPGEGDFILGSQEIPGGRRLVIYQADWGDS